jgi:hypothetical protein
MAESDFWASGFECHLRERVWEGKMQDELEQHAIFE